MFSIHLGTKVIELSRKKDCKISDFINENLYKQIVGSHSYGNKEKFYIKTNYKTDWDALQNTRKMVELKFSTKMQFQNVR